MEHFDWVSGFWFPYINFIIFAVFLVRFARSPLKQMFASRKEEYEGLLAAAQATQKEAESQLNSLNERLSGLDKEIQSIRSEAEDRARQESERIIERGKELAGQIVEEAKRVAEGEQEQIKNDLEKEILLSVREQVAEKLHKGLSDSEHNSFIDAQIKSLKKLSIG